MTKNGSGGSRYSDKRAGSGHSNPEIGRGEGSGLKKKFFFRPSGLSLKIRGRGASPGSVTEKYSNPYLRLGAFHLPFEEGFQLINIVNSMICSDIWHIKYHE